MNKKQAVLIIVVSILAGWLFNVWAGRVLTAKLSTLPLLNRMQFLSPQAPIVITNKETVRVSDSGDVALAAASIKSKTSAVVLLSQGTAQTAGNAVNLTSNGDFVTAFSTFAKTSGDYYVVLNDGRSAKIDTQKKDAATGLVYFKAQLDGVPTANFGNSADLSAGDKVVFTQKSVQSYFNKAFVATVNAAQGDVAGMVFSSDYLKRGFASETAETPVNGEAVVNTGGEVVAIYNGAWLVSSDVLKQSFALYLSGKEKISRPSYGFTYTIITPSESKLTGMAQGLLVREISSPSPAHTAGLLPGDLILQIGERTTSNGLVSEDILQQFGPGEKVELKISRKNQTMNLTLTTAELK